MVRLDAGAVGRELGLHGEAECHEAIQRFLVQIAQPLACLPEPAAVSASDTSTTDFSMEDRSVVDMAAFRGGEQDASAKAAAPRMNAV